MESIAFPDPVISVAIEPKTADDQKNMISALTQLQREDPSCVFRKNEETGQTLLMGMGELHLEILVDRLLKDYKVQARVGKPQVSFRERIKEQVFMDGKFEREISGVFYSVGISLKVAPLEMGKGIVFKNQVTDDRFSANFKSAIQKGVYQGLEVGPLMGYPIRDIEVTVQKLDFQEENLSELAMESVSYQTLRKATLKSGSVLLEPVFALEIRTPEEFTGSIIGDLNVRRGRVESLSLQKGIQTIKAKAPLLNLFGYATDIRSMSQGRASFSMSMDSYGILPERETQKILL